MLCCFSFPFYIDRLLEFVRGGVFFIMKPPSHSRKMAKADRTVVNISEETNPRYSQSRPKFWKKIINATERTPSLWFTRKQSHHLADCIWFQVHMYKNVSHTCCSPSAQSLFH